MNWFVFFLVGVPLLLGVGIAIYEKRKKTVLLRHDLNRRGGHQTEADREHARTTAAMQHKTYFDGMM